jgi:hypothetical protein
LYRARWRTPTPAFILGRVRALIAVLLVPSVALADVVDLTPRRRSGQPAALIVRAEGGNEFAPFGYVGGVLSWLFAGSNELELGIGGGFPGLQLGAAARQLFGGEGPQFLLVELAIAGNTKVDRGGNAPGQFQNIGANQSSLWTCLGLGFEQRTDIFDVSIAGDIVFTTSSLTPHFAIHGGVGFGF